MSNRGKRRALGFGGQGERKREKDVLSEMKEGGKEQACSGKRESSSSFPVLKVFIWGLRVGLHRMSISFPDVPPGGHDLH